MSTHWDVGILRNVYALGYRYFAKCLFTFSAKPFRCEHRLDDDAEPETDPNSRPALAPAPAVVVDEESRLPAAQLAGSHKKAAREPAGEHALKTGAQYDEGPAGLFIIAAVDRWSARLSPLHGRSADKVRRGY